MLVYKNYLYFFLYKARLSLPRGLLQREHCLWQSWLFGRICLPSSRCLVPLLPLPSNVSYMYQERRVTSSTSGRQDLLPFRPSVLRMGLCFAIHVYWLVETLVLFMSLDEFTFCIKDNDLLPNSTSFVDTENLVMGLFLFVVFLYLAAFQIFSNTSHLVSNSCGFRVMTSVVSSS